MALAPSPNPTSSSTAIASKRLMPTSPGWILSFSTGTTPQQLAPLVRDALQALR